MSVVLDTNVLISATLWDGSEAQKLLYQLLRSGSEIYSSNEILDEYRGILKRDFGYGSEEIAAIVKTLKKFLIIASPQQKLAVVKDDPDDNRILECAVEAGASIIISYDKHLLNMQSYHSIRILKPSAVFH